MRGLVVRYGSITAMHGVDLHVDADEIVAIVGPNGAGKTSLLSAVAGIVRPAAVQLPLPVALRQPSRSPTSSAAAWRWCRRAATSSAA